MDIERYEAKVIAAAKECGYSRCQLAAALRMTQGTLKLKLSGRSCWRLDEMVVLASILSIPLLQVASEAADVYARANPDGILAQHIASVRWCLGCTDQPAVAEDDDT